MSDASHSHEEEAHEGPVKTPKQLLVTVIFSFVIPIFVCVMLATYVTTDHKPAAGSDGFSSWPVVGVVVTAYSSVRAGPSVRGAGHFRFLN